MTRLNRTLIGLIPFFALALSAISGLVSSKEWYYSIFKYAGDSVGYSLLFLIPMYLYYKKFRYCWATKLAVIALAVNNLISLFCKAYQDIYGIDIYNPLYDLAVLTLTTILTFIVLLSWRYKAGN